MHAPVVQTEAATFDQTPTWAAPYVTAQVPRLPHWIDPSESGQLHQHGRGNPRGRHDRSAGPHRRPAAAAPGRLGHRPHRSTHPRQHRRRHPGSPASCATANSSPSPARLLATVRTPTDACRREVEHVHDHELTLALTNLVRDAGGITHDELTTRVARLYGWTRRGPDISTRLRHPHRQAHQPTAP